ncbi:hypothetical protein RMATCC62417_13990 [Rhizopus microsporus]|nr:hypothetical protein RMATCC62417_13990 [Rhizopus microsporus]
MDLLNFTQQDQPPPTNTDILGDLDMRNQKHYATIHSDNDVSERKIKIQISLIECFILHQHPSNNISIFDQDLVDLNQGHIRLTMDQLNIRIQQFSSHDQCVNIRLSDLTLDEWVETNHGLRCQPMIQFDDSIKKSYSHQDLFPSFYDTEQSVERGSVEVIRIKLDNKRGNISLDEDIYVDIQAFKLLVDPRTVDRLEQYILAIINRSPSSSSRPTLPPPPQNLDLSTSEVPTNTKLRIKCAFIRLVLLSPDMSQATSRYEYTDKCHDYQLSVDIKKPVISWSSSPSEEKKKGRKESNGRNFALRINIELNYINVFMKEDGLVQCWFTVKTVQDKDLLSDTLSPSIELTIKDPASIHLQTDASEFELPRVLFDELRQGQKNMSIENQSDSALIFKQRTIETSQLVANCHFPQTYMNLTKKRWDKVQTIQNDLLLWQPRFLLNVEKTSGEQQQEGPSLLSIVAVMSQGLWYLQPSDDHLYTLDFSEFKYFACMKHLGRNENITTLDIEQLALNDMIKQRPLICRTLPKIMASSKNKPMVSIFSRLLLFPDMNRINKDSSVVICNLCWKATPDISFIDQLVYFQQMPEDINLIDPPTQCVEVYTNVLETSIDYDPNDYPFRCVILADRIQVVTEILTGQSILEINISVDSIQLLFSELKHNPLIDEKNMGNNSTSEAYWTNLGLIPLAGLRSIELDVKLKLLDHIIAPKADVALTNATIHLDTHADSFQSLINLITHLSTLKEDFDNGSESKQPFHKLHSPSTVKQFMNEQDMLASLDENAFKMMMSRETKISPPTLIEVPEIEDYEEEFYASPTIKTASPPMKPPRHIKRSEDIVRMLVSDELELIDDFYGSSSLNATSETRNTLERTSGAVLSLHVSHVNLVWKLYDGYDWDYVRAEMAARKHDRRTTSMTDQGGGFYQRKRDTAQMEVQLTGIDVDFHLMPTHEKTVMRFQLRIKDVDIIDNIKTSAWKKFLGYMKSPTVFREKDEQMVDIQLTCLRPVDDPELRLKAKLLPVRLYIDQDALNFLVGFFTFDKMIVKSTPIMNYIPSKEPKADETFFHTDRL